MAPSHGLKVSRVTSGQEVASISNCLIVSREYIKMWILYLTALQLKDGSLLYCYFYNCTKLSIKLLIVEHWNIFTPQSRRHLYPVDTNDLFTSNDAVIQHEIIYYIYYNPAYIIYSGFHTVEKRKSFDSAERVHVLWRSYKVQKAAMAMFHTLAAGMPSLHRHRR